jgi:hypothetical protein
MLFLQEIPLQHSNPRKSDPPQQRLLPLHPTRNLAILPQPSRTQSRR